MKRDSKIYVAGHRGLVGSAICRRLAKGGFANVLCRTSKELDLRNQQAVNDFFENEKLEYLFLAAAKVGGIHANDTYPADFICDNLQMQTNVIDAAYRHGVKKLLFLGSSCIYPKFAPQPIAEDSLLTGALEPTNEWYALAKIAGIKMCQAYRRQYGFNAISVMPTNLYGPNDNFDLENSHVLPALLRKFHEAKTNGQPTVSIWGTGKVSREFLHVDDLADAALFLMQNYDDEQIVNVGTGIDLSIAELAAIVGNIVGFEGTIVYDSDKPDGTPRKLLDVKKLQKLGWKARIDFREGIVDTYQWYLKNLA